jgi:peptidoglycan hydrolase-like protein with peptidoglycan-binding domain
MRGADVSALQQLLKTQNYFTSDITGYFGVITAGAVASYQSAHNLESVGRVGPKTLALLNGQPIPTTTTTLPPPTYTPAPSGPTCLAYPGTGITHTLSLGTCSTEVQTLQKMLNSLGFTVAASGTGSPGYEGLLFGSYTQAAVIKFQKQYGITDQRGVVGVATRGKLTQLTSGKSF